jgi:hypothetical protein
VNGSTGTVIDFIFDRNGQGAPKLAEAVIDAANAALRRLQGNLRNAAADYLDLEYARTLTRNSRMLRNDWDRFESLDATHIFMIFSPNLSPWKCDTNWDSVKSTSSSLDGGFGQVDHNSGERRFA